MAFIKDGETKVYKDKFIKDGNLKNVSRTEPTRYTVDDLVKDSDPKIEEDNPGEEDVSN